MSTKSKHAAVLNALDEMQSCWHYAARSSDLAEAERVILEQEQQLATVTAERDAIRKDLLEKYGDGITLQQWTQQREKLTAELDEYRACNEHHKAQFLATNLELSRMRAERDQWRNYSWTEAVQFIAATKENLLQQYCNLQILYGEQKHRIRDLEKELAQANTHLEAQRVATYQAVEREQRVKRELSQAQAREASLFEAIKHGDEKHQAWLKETIDKHFAIKEAQP
jgi:ribosomal protein L29